MSYNQEHLAKLGALKELAQRVKEDYASKESVTALEKKVNAIKVPTKVSELSNDSGYQTGTQVDEKINAKVASVYKSKGSVNTYAELPKSNQQIGDVYNVVTAEPSKNVKAGDNLVWIGSNGGENKDGWDNLGGKVDLSGYVQKEEGKGLSSNDYTDAEKEKLEGLSNYTHPTYTPKESGLYKVTVDSTGHVSDATPVAKKDITDLGIPSQDTTYSNATQAKAGLMSAEDKKKLDGMVVATPAEVTEMLNEIFGTEV